MAPIFFSYNNELKQNFLNAPDQHPPIISHDITKKKSPDQYKIDPGMPWFIHVSALSLVQRESNKHFSQAGLLTFGSPY